ncbi:glycerophosphodiester phosphodiesterase [Staphylococcus caeli]|uniref:Glycerophosphoryl diester phosphodiesterase n=1 Tax=Staphylococcus caeli TaxID=2201815 RepID=A0A1D4H207_9STAP|nr:glycerophosphodiester phosphodiesterase family protein [Staphylococcus caeli]SCS31219.1 glycerophosphoryl diester phosphodiesterase [Staphylococcus caeli]SCS64239.1 glycerophosphoryl diester phosphodiesterase [Staphylococcus caeli]
MQNQKHKQKELLYVAHRGLATAYPENTYIAFEAALKSGVDILEIDIHCTADGKLVVIHDETIDRTSNGSGHVGSLTLEALRHFDFGIHKGVAFKGQRILLLAEVLELIKNYPQRLLIEIKKTHLYSEIENKLIEQLKVHGMPTEKVIIQSFDAQCIQNIASMDLGYELGVLISKRKFWYRMPNFKKISTYAKYINPQYTLINRRFIKKANDYGLSVLPYTVNQKHAAAKLIELGVDGLISDNPEKLM